MKRGGMSTAEIERELLWLRQHALDELLREWQSDDRWCPWRPEEDRFRGGWNEHEMEQRRRRIDHNNLMRAHLRTVRALDFAIAAVRRVS